MLRCLLTSAIAYVLGSSPDDQCVDEQCVSDNSEFIQMRHTVERPGVSHVRIPCKIVQTYSLPLGSLPKTMEQARLTWERLNPEYEYHYMTDADMQRYVQMKGRWLPGLVSTFSALTMPAEKADVFRFLYIYNEGGVYADIDTALRKPMREVLQPTDQFVVFATDAGVLEGFWFAAAQYHPLLKHMLERIVDEVRGHTILANGTCTDCPLYPLLIAGPHQLTRAATDLLFPEVSKSLPPRVGNKRPHAWHHFEPGRVSNAENTFHLRVPGFANHQDAIITKYREYAKDLHSTNNTYWQEDWKVLNASPAS